MILSSVCEIECKSGARAPRHFSMRVVLLASAGAPLNSSSGVHSSSSSVLRVDSTCPHVAGGTPIYVAWRLFSEQLHPLLTDCCVMWITGLLQITVSTLVEAVGWPEEVVLSGGSDRGKRSFLTTIAAAAAVASADTPVASLYKEEGGEENNKISIIIVIRVFAREDFHL